MHLEQIDHIGFAVHDLDAALTLYRDLFGLELLGLEAVADQGVRVAMLRLGESRLELLCPLGPDSPVARFLERRGEGIHHIAYRVQDLSRCLGELTAAGIPLIDQTPRIGAHGTRIAFVHPRATRGVLTELCEPMTPSESSQSEPTPSGS